MSTSLWTNTVPEAIKNFSTSLQSTIILSESDLKVELCTHLKGVLSSNGGGTCKVKTENPWYDDKTGEGPLYIDITVIDESKLEFGYIPHLKSKGYRYVGSSIAIELKYCRKRANLAGVIEDIEKLLKVAQGSDNDCFCYVVALTTPELQTELRESISTAYQDLSKYDKSIKVYLLCAGQATEEWEFIKP